MSYTMEDFNRQYIKDHFLQLTPEEQEEVLKSMSPERRLAGLSAKQIREHLDRLTANRSGAPGPRRRKK